MEETINEEFEATFFEVKTTRPLIELSDNFIGFICEKCGHEWRPGDCERIDVDTNASSHDGGNYLVVSSTMCPNCDEGTGYAYLRKICPFKGDNSKCVDVMCPLFSFESSLVQKSESGKIRVHRIGSCLRVREINRKGRS